MATKKEIVKEIFKLTESKENYEKIKKNWHYLKFIGLTLDCTQRKYAMAIDFNKFSKFEYINAYNEIKKAIA